jgi:putative spermidine/putrescine transport system ATP-binding protein
MPVVGGASKLRGRPVIDLTGTTIRLKNCSKTFPDGTRALHPTDLDVQAGETIVLLGPSGCGKTTTLRIIAGLENPDPGGKVFFGGEDVTDIPIEKRNVGMVFQSYALFPNLTVAGNVVYGLRVRQVASAERAERTDEMLAMMRISHLKDRRIDELSGGQRQRVALARAIIVRPRVLLLDEPLTALDAKLREDLRLEIDALLRRLHITSVYVTHDQAEAMALGDRIVVMSEGRIAQIGSPREIYFRPQTAFVADFIGTTNRLSGVASDGLLKVAGGDLTWGGPDGPVTVMCRPEDVDVLEADAIEASGVLRGRVRNVFFLGDRTRLVIEGIGDQPMIVETPSRREFFRDEIVAVRIAAERLTRLEPGEANA